MLLVVLTSTASCNKEDVRLSEPQLTRCDSKRKTVKEADGLEGQIWFNKAVQEYAIYVSVDGTYDTQYVGIPCELSEEFKKEGLRVVFSGKYKDFSKQPTTVMPGQTYYYLNLSKIEIKP